MTSEYRVNLDIYNGPLDLLLYLIRREEVDIYDIPVARVTEGYIQYVDLLKQLDPNIAGEFLVMAATLVEIKTRMMLPAPESEEGQTEGVEIDPRTELVRQLLEYKAFKDAAGDLREAQALRSQKFARAGMADLGKQDGLDLEDVQVWDLLDAFSDLLTAIGSSPGDHEIIYDDTPLELHAVDITDRLGREGAMSFAQVFAGRTERVEIVGLFLALLELVRRREVLVAQKRNFGEIELRLNPDPPETEQEDGTLGDIEAPAPPGESDRTSQEGQYISETEPQETHERSGGEDTTTGN
jgi:segregation and condensation protein A